MDKPLALVDIWRAEAEPDATSDADLAPILDAAVDTGRAAWPMLALGADCFVRRLARHWPGDESTPAWIARLRLDDLYLACACQERVAGAIEAFDRKFLDAVPAILRRSAPPGMNADEIRQQVRERLFVGAAKIGDYSGRGALANWVDVVTLRIAIDAKRREPDVIGLSSASGATQLVEADPELEFIKERYRDVFKAGLKAALRGVSSEQRNLLKLHFVDEVTLDQMATLFHVHRATISRHIAAAREAVFDGVRKHLEAELSLDRAEFDSLLNLVRSRINLSLSLLLAESFA